MLRYKTDLDLV